MTKQEEVDAALMLCRISDTEQLARAQADLLKWHGPEHCKAIKDLWAWFQRAIRRHVREESEDTAQSNVEKALQIIDKLNTEPEMPQFKFIEELRGCYIYRELFDPAVGTDPTPLYVKAVGLWIVGVLRRYEVDRFSNGFGSEDLDVRLQHSGTDFWSQVSVYVDKFLSDYKLKLLPQGSAHMQAVLRTYESPIQLARLLPGNPD